MMQAERGSAGGAARHRPRRPGGEHGGGGGANAGGAARGQEGQEALTERAEVAAGLALTGGQTLALAASWGTGLCIVISYTPSWAGRPRGRRSVPSRLRNSSCSDN